MKNRRESAGTAQRKVERGKEVDDIKEKHQELIKNNNLKEGKC